MVHQGTTEKGMGMRGVFVTEMSRHEHHFGFFAESTPCLSSHFTTFPLRKPENTITFSPISASQDPTPRSTQASEYMEDDSHDDEDTDTKEDDSPTSPSDHAYNRTGPKLVTEHRDSFYNQAFAWKEAIRKITDSNNDTPSYLTRVEILEQNKGVICKQRDLS
ncbi:hypothetical protein BDU57DRAFT_13467 [Ampelomyces quisqualis]|uniref:Uncharacterized protein n=1 Tax=Ampelomyces quisqualis TaxID=50730 RepID=A0A6A5R0N8_AMPQU|nr:hypothetical protein BDU57DRAFT_13467 [Ampelomyces quisqualis]